MDFSSCFIYVLPFAKQNRAEVWPRFQILLNLLFWTKGVEWVLVLDALSPLCLWQCLCHAGKKQEKNSQQNSQISSVDGSNAEMEPGAFSVWQTKIAVVTRWFFYLVVFFLRDHVIFLLDCFFSWPGDFSTQLFCDFLEDHLEV